METKEVQSVFNTLNSVNVNGHTEKKGRLTYLSWAWAWAEVKKRYADASYTIYENASGMFYHTDGKTCWVKTGVTIMGLEHIEYLPVMDNMNKSIPLEKVTSFDVNTAIQRSLTKACARHGLGLYIYAGEDLPDAPAEEPKEEVKPATTTKKAETAPALVNIPAPKNADEKELAACKTKADLRKLLVDKSWTTNEELVSYAKLLSSKLPETAA